MIDMEVWKPHQIRPGECLEAQVGPALIWLRKSGDEIHIATKHHENAKSLTEPVAFRVVSELEPAGLDWSRWVCGNKCRKVLLTPVMPDRPIVVRPELPVKIPSGGTALFFVGIPIWIRITAVSAKEFKLAEEPSVDLSNIWFGDPMSGHLCYSLRSRARREIADTQAQPHRASCPVTIRNASAEQVSVERFCVHVAHLGIYGGTSRLWTNGVNIAFKGEAEVSQLEYSKTPPEYEDVGEVLSRPRIPVKTALLKRSFGGFGLFGGA
ncbi:MAG: DUF432 domain-containing protein [Planctomycetota bacterium]|jgi:hypothetical protein